VLELAASIAIAADSSAVGHAGGGGYGSHNGRDHSVPPYMRGAAAPVPVAQPVAMRGGLEEEELVAAVVRIRSGVGEDGERIKVQEVKAILEKEGVFVSASQVTKALGLGLGLGLGLVSASQVIKALGLGPGLGLGLVCASQATEAVGARLATKALGLGSSRV
jgi:hypothetical protein